MKVQLIIKHSNDGINITHMILSWYIEYQKFNTRKVGHSFKGFGRYCPQMVFAKCKLLTMQL